VGALPVAYPEHCPACGTPLARDEGMAQHYCPNGHASPPPSVRRREQFVGRRATDIAGPGGATAEALFKADLVRHVADLYDLDKAQLLGLGKGWGERSAEVIIKGIAASKLVPFERVLFALGIRHVGEAVAKKIARAVGSIDRLAG